LQQVGYAGILVKKKAVLRCCWLLLCVAGVLISCRGGRISTDKGNTIVLLSDWGGRDAYVAQMKGSILSTNPLARVLDLNHDVQGSPPISFMEASYLLDKAVASFPSGTIFVVAVDSGTGSSPRSILLHTKADKYYIGPDNGILTHVLERELVDQVVELNNRDYFRAGELSPIQLGRDIFGPVAGHLSTGVDLSKMGSKLKDINRLKILTPALLGNKTNGQVVHVDRYGNVITNIRRDHLSAQAKGKLLKISFKGRSMSSPFLETTTDAPADRTICYINSDGEFEIALRNASAAAVHGLKVGDLIALQN
jgi:S-adenosyl-L-methionine hydrolase (adenosine-forming)